MFYWAPMSAIASIFSILTFIMFYGKTPPRHKQIIVSLYFFTFYFSLFTFSFLLFPFLLSKQHNALWFLLIVKERYLSTNDLLHFRDDAFGIFGINFRTADIDFNHTAVDPFGVIP